MLPCIRVRDVAVSRLVPAFLQRLIEMFEKIQTVILATVRSMALF